MGKRVIVVTGFGPFEGHPVNASWESVKLLPSLWQHEQFELVIDEIPVNYEFNRSNCPEKWQHLDPFFYVHVGVHGRAKDVILEKVAHNGPYERKDIDGKLPPTCSLCVVDKVDSTQVLCTELDLDQIANQLNRTLSDAKVCTSNDAGRYLCDYVYYKSLFRSEGKSLFIHVPPLDAPYSKDQLAMVIIEVIKQIISLRSSAP